MNSIKTIRTSSDNKDFLQLINQLDKELRDNYGDAQNSYDKHNKVEKLDTVIVIYNENQPVACGCFKPFEEGIVELKRMFVSKLNRGKGLSKIVLSELEKWVTELGHHSIVLETAILQKEAIFHIFPQRCVP